MPLKQFGSKKSPRRIIGIAAGKGGVGKSTLTVNLALALRTQGYKVGILDADLYGPSIRAMLPESQPPSQNGDQLIPAMSNGIAIMSMAFFKSKEQASVIRAPIASRLIGQFLNQVEWGDLDYLLIDFPPGTGDIQITLSQQASLTAALVVTTPQEIALLDVRKCIEMFDQVHIPIVGIVENMSYFIAPGTNEKLPLFGMGGGENLAKESGSAFLGQIPINPIIGQCLDAGKSLFHSQDPASDHLKECFSKIAYELETQLDKLATATKPFEIIWDQTGSKTSSDNALKPNLIREKTANMSIQSIKQVTDSSFMIEWSNGSILHYPLSLLQKHCPCAACAEGKKPNDPAVRAYKIRNVGRYAIQIDFSSGCSKGIYDFDMLYNINFEASTCV